MDTEQGPTLILMKVQLLRICLYHQHEQQIMD